MGTCLVAGCNGYALTDSVCALCANTQPVRSLTRAMALGRERDAEEQRRAASSRNPDAEVLLVCTNGSTRPNETFAAACQDYTDRFFAILAKGPGGGTPERVQGCMVYHNTQPSANRTVFYDWQGNNLRVFGVGSHVGGNGSGNDSYGFTWFDGKSKTYTR